MTVQIRVDGIRDLQRALREVDRGLPRRLKRVWDDAAETIASQTRRKVPTRSGRLAASVKARSQQREGRVQMGTPSRVPYAGWIEFGGTIRHRGHGHVGDHGIRRRFVPSGRFLFPTGVENLPVVRREAEAGIEALMREAGLL